jgi:threonine dehydratase
VALVASELGFPCRVFLPVKTPQIKIDAIKKLGATAILHGEALDDANRVAMQTAEREHCAYIHPFESEAVMAGQATVMIELIQQITQLDSVIVSVGGGGLISGIISACKHFAPHVKVVGVEPKGAHSLWLSMQAGHIVKIPITSVAESLGVPKTEPRQFEIISQYVNELVVVEDNQSINSLLEILSEEKILVEPAASCCVAALDTGKISIDLGKRVAIIMCGGNIGLDRVWQWFGERQIK